MVELDYFEIPNDWEYRGEGNCHVVLGLPKMKKVLRIRKKDRPKTLIQWFLYFLENCLSWLRGGEEAAEERDLRFYLKIMRPMFGSNYVSDAKQVKLSRGEVKTIVYQLSRLRPDFRKNKILDFGRATLFQDFTKLQSDFFNLELAEDTFSIEIKPKKGWTPFTERSFPECIFCMNQYLKLKSKKIYKRSNYCPRDLFSGDEIRMNKAILALIDNPQNNFRIFKNGQIIYDENSAKSEVNVILQELFQNFTDVREELLCDFAYLIFQCLTKPFGVQPECSVNLFCKWDRILQAECLPKGCILEKILSVQMVDVEGPSYYNNFLKGDISQWGYVDKLLRSMDERMCVKCSLRTLTNTAPTVNDAFALSLYLISAIASDCSLMVTLRKIRNESDIEEFGNVVQSKFGSFLVNVGVFDLYPKLMSTIRKHVIRNKELLELYKIMEN